VVIHEKCEFDKKPASRSCNEPITAFSLSPFFPNPANIVHCAVYMLDRVDSDRCPKRSIYFSLSINDFLHF
jgi:hypothetical protein